MSPARLILLASLTASPALVSSLALAQDKPAPALVQPQLDPAPDYQAWANAYVQAGEPEIAVVAFEAASQLDPVTLESLVRTLSGDSVPAKLRSALIQELQTPPADVQLVDTEFALAAAKRLGANLRQADDPDALRVLGRELNAQLYIVTRLTPSQRPGSPFSVLFEATNAVTGRSILNFQFDWKGGTDALNINRNATQIARKFIETYVQRATNPARYTVRVFGLESPEHTAAARKALQRVEGVTSVLTREENNVSDPFAGPGGAIASLTRFELRLQPGADADATAMLAGIADEVGFALGANVQTMQAGQGAVAVRVSDVGTVEHPSRLEVPEPVKGTVTVDTTVTTSIAGKTESTTSSSTVEIDLNDPAWRDKLDAAIKSREPAQPAAQPAAAPAATHSPSASRAIDPRAAARGARQMVASTAAGRALREQWLSAYEAKGSPRMLVLVNRAATPREPLQPARDAAANVATQIIVSANGLGTGDAAGNQSNAHSGTSGWERPRWDERIPVFEQPEQLAFQARALEGRVGAMFGPELMGASKIIDAEAAKGQFADEFAKRAEIGDSELMGLLKQRNIADVVVLGFGRVVARGGVAPSDEIGWADDDQAARNGNVVVYTFKAVDLRDNTVLGFADVTGLDDSFTTDGLSDVAMRAVGKLAWDSLQRWK
jgi:hypothetical protein